MHFGMQQVVIDSTLQPITFNYGHVYPKSLNIISSNLNKRPRAHCGKRIGGRSKKSGWVRLFHLLCVIESCHFQMGSRVCIRR